MNGSPPSPRGCTTKINLLVDHGVRTFVDLTQPADGLEPYVDHVERIDAQRGLELHHRPFPIPDMSVRSQDGYDEIAVVVSLGIQAEHLVEALSERLGNRGSSINKKSLADGSPFGRRDSPS